MMNVGSVYSYNLQNAPINPSNSLTYTSQNCDNVAIRDYCVGRSGFPSYAIINGQVYPADGLKIVEAHNEIVGKIINPQTGQVLSDRAMISGWTDCLNIENK